MMLPAALLTGCNDDEPDDPIIPDEEEVITTVRYHLVHPVTGDTATFEYRDPDGDGGDAPTIMADSVDSGVVYMGHIVLLNETEDPAEDVTEEIEEEDEDHQLFFPVSGLDITVAYGDADGNGNPIGLKTTFTPNEKGSGSLSVILRHEPDKTASGVADGDPTNAGGETDIEVVFDVEVR